MSEKELKGKTVKLLQDKEKQLHKIWKSMHDMDKKLSEEKI